MSTILVRGKLIKHLRLLYLFGIPVGISPYKINQKGELYFNIQSIIQTILALLLQIISPLFLYKLLEKTHEEKIKTQLLVMVMDVQHQFWYFINISLVIIEFWNRQKFFTILNDLQKYEQDSFTPTNYKKLKIMIVKYHVVVILAVGSSISNDLFAAKNFWMHFLYSVLNFMLYFVKPFMLLKFLIMNYLVKTKFGDVNRFLERLREKEKSKVR